jgi:hypothetical protein
LGGLSGSTAFKIFNPPRATVTVKTGISLVSRWKANWKRLARSFRIMSRHWSELDWPSPSGLAVMS